MKTKKGSRKEIASTAVLINSKKTSRDLEDYEPELTDHISRDEKKREAGKPLYLVRYE